MNERHYTYNIICARAVALLTLLYGLSSCVTGEDDATYGGTVSSDLALCVSPSQATSTRMPAHTDGSSDAFDVTQASGKFRGIQDLTLITLNSEGTVLPSIIPTMTQQGKTYHYLTDELTELKIGTSRFIGYARAIPETGKTKFENGSVISTIPNDKNPADIKFDLEPIVTGSTVYTVAESMAAYLTGIANTAGFKSEYPTLHEEFVNYGNPIAGSTANVKKWVELLNEKLPTLNETVKNNLETTIGTINAHFTVNYPGNINLPDGAAAMKWIETKPEGATDDGYPKFVVLKASGNSSPLSDHTRFTYPAELFYFCDSPIRTSTTSQKSNYTTPSWSTVLGYYSTNSIVQSTTRSVAIEEPLQYGVCCLITTIKAEAAELEDYDDNLITVGTSNFPLTGILVGGQFQQFYNFESNPDKNAKEYIIYDKEMSSNIYLTTTESAPNYTLVFQSRDDKLVDIVLEFENKSGSSFVGYEGGIVYPGTKFYLVGQAEPKKVVTADVEKRVFTQDYKTTLQLTIGSLKGAYNVIPELKTAQYSVKVSNVGVKQWTPGGSQDHDLYNW